MKKCSVSVNEELMGEVMGHLTVIGAAIQEGFDNKDGVVTFCVKIPHKEIVRFSEWLSGKTGERGELSFLSD